MTLVEKDDGVTGEQYDLAPVFLYDSLTVVLVGPDKQRFDLHKGLICKQSDFFKAALSGGFREADGQILLPDQDPETFKYFVNWLYTGKLRGFYYPSTMKPTLAELRVAVEGTMVERQWTEAEMLNDPIDPAYLALYTLADSLQVLGLKDPIISLLVEVYACTLETSENVTLPFWDHTIENPTWLPSLASSLNLAWEKLPRGSSLRKVLILLFCDNVADARALTTEDEIKPGFLACCLDIMLQRWIQGQDPTPWEEKGVICKFHEHDVECVHSSQISYLDNYDRLASA